MDKSSLVMISDFFYCQREDVVKSLCPILPHPKMICHPEAPQPCCHKPCSAVHNLFTWGNWSLSAAYQWDPRLPCTWKTCSTQVKPPEPPARSSIPLLTLAVVNTCTRHSVPHTPWSELRSVHTTYSCSNCLPPRLPHLPVDITGWFGLEHFNQHVVLTGKFSLMK